MLLDEASVVESMVATVSNCNNSIALLFIVSSLYEHVGVLNTGSLAQFIVPVGSLTAMGNTYTKP